MAPVLKTGIPERVSGVRIPPSPPVSAGGNYVVVGAKTRRRSRVLWKSHCHDIPTAGFGSIEAFVRGLEQFTGC